MGPMLRSRATLIAFALAPLGASGLAACLGEDVSSDPSGAAVDAAADATPSAADGGSSEADGGQDAAAEASRPTCGGKSFSSPTAIGMPNGWPAEFYGARLDAVDWPTASVDAYFGSEAPGIPSEQHLFRARFSPQGLALTDPVRLTPTASGDQSVNWSPTVVASTLLFARGSLGARRLARMLPDGGSATALATAGVVAGTEASEAFFVPGTPTRVYYAFRGSFNAHVRDPRRVSHRRRAGDAHGHREGPRVRGPRLRSPGRQRGRVHPALRARGHPRHERVHLVGGRRACRNGRRRAPRATVPRRAARPELALVRRLSPDLHRGRLAPHVPRSAQPLSDWRGPKVTVRARRCRGGGAGSRSARNAQRVR